MDIVNNATDQTITMNDDIPFVPTKVNPESKYFPLCICWSTIPILSWLVPCLGHTAISDPNGWIYDFQGSYSIGRRRQTTCFGSIKKYVELNINVSNDEYINAIEEVNIKYSKLTHNLVTQNCHEHVADVLNKIAYKNKTTWGTLSILWLLFKDAKYVSNKAILFTYLPFLFILFTFILFTTFFIVVLY
ncbi:hypothetical protein EHI8A_059880 [Entamoeba histolytica HM-1:IMSS-B]|uniref:Uncharacterized protein n=6 Tax=Entamoeba histolytica TaxID=5759 RepID=C4LTB6_ENTH1|nr:hypothetical protein, conserved [Entamoeba histolytica HM-1:IMSS]EMD48917.1 H20J04.6, putative [Entamoeba histolytica KU27]EMH74067.1 hypothetical protein EHI8A_059880 [Entamoeba histolytica HM-1:IMSS-B]EMS13631.1 H20J04.6, putative [Entamoeba histolytica HM-3:IMSS]ENY60808.1 hypothetical protein EHI7A_058150 [Entamoeba histolytica HM-1:IMSS-A]GAT91798.1 hypothetical protein conserved [Entamoeba histolytica]|eukprot:XP_657259.1 hypothetical protein, conserved [Entamoeba histolytica HM-1:IMSS]